MHTEKQIYKGKEDNICNKSCDQLEHRQDFKDTNQLLIHDEEGIP